MVSEKLFSVSNFSNFWKFRNRFWYQLKTCFDKLLILSELRYFFVKILTLYKTDLKHAVTMPSPQGCCLTCALYVPNIFGFSLFAFNIFDVQANNVFRSVSAVSKSLWNKQMSEWDLYLKIINFLGSTFKVFRRNIFSVMR